MDWLLSLLGFSEEQEPFDFGTHEKPEGKHEHDPARPDPPRSQDLPELPIV